MIQHFGTPTSMKALVDEYTEIMLELSQNDDMPIWGCL